MRAAIHTRELEIETDPIPQCDFEWVDKANWIKKCKRCCFIEDSPFDLHQIHRQCRVIDFNNPEVRSRLNGFGDTIAVGLKLFGFKTCVNCNRRAHRINRIFSYKPIYKAIDVLKKKLGVKPKILIHFYGGLGDSVQFSTILLHLRYYFPGSDIQVDIRSPTGRHTIFDWFDSLGPADREPLPSQYDAVYEIPMYEPEFSFTDHPASKPEHMLKYIIGKEPIPELCRYELTAPDYRIQESVDCYHRLCGNQKAVMVQYQGDSWPEHKQINEGVIEDVCRVVSSKGLVPLILDPGDKCTFSQDKVIVLGSDDPFWGCEGDKWDAAKTFALGNLCQLRVGVDSGPGHLFGATRADGVPVPPTLIVWPRAGYLHPVHHYGLAEHVTHLVQPDHWKGIRGDWGIGETYFTKAYHHRIMKQHIRYELPEVVGRMLDGENVRDPYIPEQLLTIPQGIVRQGQIGHDRRVLIEHLENDDLKLANLPDLDRPVWVDIGAHIGAATLAAKARFERFGAAIAVDIAPESQDALNANVGAFAKVLHAGIGYANQPLEVARCNDTSSLNILATVGETHEIEHREANWGRTWNREPLRCPIYTLERLMEDNYLERIDVLKLDCEGSERGILENAQCLDRVGMIVGEWHGEGWFKQLCETKLPDWNLIILQDWGGLGLFQLFNPLIRERKWKSVKSYENWESLQILQDISTPTVS